MKNTLYLLRKLPDRIDPSLFLASESQGDIVLLDESGMSSFPYEGGTIFSLSNNEGHNSLSYDGLVRKIFEHDHTIVV